MRRRFLSDGLTLLVLDSEHLREQDRELRGVHDALFDDYQRLVFGRIVGEDVQILDLDSVVFAGRLLFRFHAEDRAGDGVGCGDFNPFAAHLAE